MGSYNKISTFYVGKAKFPADAEVFGSLGQAFSEIAELRRSGVNQPITVKLAAGEYFFGSAMEIKNNLTAVTVEPFGNAEAVISGGKLLKGFEKSSFNGVECFALAIPEVKDGSWKFTDLYVDGKRADLTRFPEKGFFSFLSCENKETHLFDSSKWITVDPGDLACISDKSLENAVISYCHYWIDEHSPIESFDRESGKLVMKHMSRFEMSGEKEYYLENVPEAFGKPNSWYLDVEGGMLYYKPRCESQTPENISVHAPVAERLLNITGTPEKPVCNICFRNITFAHTRGDYKIMNSTGGEPGQIEYASDSQAVSNAHAAINLEYAEYCAFDNCKMTNYGLHGININKGCNNIRVINSAFFDGGGGGVKINGASAKDSGRDITHNNIIFNNTIKSCGRRYMASCGVLMMHSHSNVISHNEICDLFYTGISGGWVWGYSDSVSRNNLIKKNHIHNLGQGVLSDMGGVYLLGAQSGTVVSGNLIHDVKSKRYGGWALYTDEGSGFITLENNVCYNTSNNSYHQHYGRMNVVRNNIFAFSDLELVCITRFEQHLSIIFENNIMYTKGPNIYSLSMRHFKNSTVGAGNNVFWGKNGAPAFHGELKTLEDVQKYGMDAGSIVADPMFADADNFDFTLKDESPAIAMGFVPIDISEAGPIR
ncbi:MAG: hypothetical protein FWG34_00645 [Oscillospiraceae bacterium]|nr:hypothetical protein [Oscillospiraceae bacterium]